MTKKQLIAEILTDLRKYDDLGLIDMRTLDQTIKNELKRFGSNIMETRQEFVEIKGGVTRLPENFYKLRSAYRTRPKEVNCEDEKDSLWRTDTYVTRVIENEYGWDNHSNSHYKKAYKEVVEQKLIRGSKVYVKHDVVEKVWLTRGISKDYLSNKCINEEVSGNIKGSVITLTNSMITANFNEGVLFITYEALPEQDGDLYIPDYPNLINYLTSKVKHKMLEGIWINDEIDTVAQKVSYFNQKATEHFIAAQTEVKFNGLPSNISKKMRAKNATELRKYYK